MVSRALAHGGHTTLDYKNLSAHSKFRDCRVYVYEILVLSYTTSLGHDNWPKKSCGFPVANEI